MKKIILLLSILLVAAQLLNAQDKDRNVAGGNKNMVKINLFALALKNVTVQYEREISKKTTVAIDVRTMPKSGLPFESSFRNAISDQSTKDQLDNFKTSNFALMPQIRFYMGHKGAYHGFYIAPFLSYAHYTGDLPYSYIDSGVSKTIPLAGSINTISGGLMFGAQWKLGQSIYLDWWIFGPHYGSSNGSISGKKSLSSSEQSALKSDLDGLNIPIVKITNSVDASGATINFSGPWAGVRAGLCIGFRF